MKNKIKAKIKKCCLFFGLILLFSIFFLILFYFWSPVNQFNKIFFKTIPYPIALIDKTTLITTRDLLANTESFKKFYDSQDFSELGMRVDFETKQGEQRLKIKEKQIFDKLIEDKIIKIIANSKGINISKKEAEEELITKAREAGSIENLALNLRKSYNWSLSDFRDKIILPQFYLKQLMDYYKKEELKNISSETKIRKAYEELNLGISFDEVAIKYSQGETAKNGGELGWFRKNQLSSEIADKVYLMQPGEFSEIIKSPLGSHLIYLEEIKEDEGNKEVKLKQIFTQEGNFLSWFNKEKSNLEVKILLKDYYWSKDEVRVKFSDESLEKNENILQNMSDGDPSIY